MEQPKFTRGPWTVSEVGFYIEAAEGQITIGEVRGYDPTRLQSAQERDDANATLISAAPDLYDELRDACRCCAQWHGDDPNTHSCGTCETWRAALAKAEGRDAR